MSILLLNSLRVGQIKAHADAHLPYQIAEGRIFPKVADLTTPFFASTIGSGPCASVLRTLRAHITFLIFLFTQNFLAEILP
jgi:hypothetical protein